MSVDHEAGFEVGETWVLDLDSGEWSQTPPPWGERRPPGRAVITKVTGTSVTFDAAPALPTAAPPGNRRARRAAKARAPRPASSVGTIEAAEQDRKSVV